MLPFLCKSETTRYLNRMGAENKLELDFLNGCIAFLEYSCSCVGHQSEPSEFEDATAHWTQMVAITSGKVRRKVNLKSQYCDRT